MPATLATLAPASAVAGDAGFALTVTGTGFAAGDTVRLDGASRPTTVVSATTLVCPVLATDLLLPGDLPITVWDASAGAEIGPLTLAIDPAAEPAAEVYPWLPPD